MSTNEHIKRFWYLNWVLYQRGITVRGEIRCRCSIRDLCSCRSWHWNKYKLIWNLIEFLGNKYKWEMIQLHKFYFAQTCWRGFAEAIITAYFPPIDFLTIWILITSRIFQMFHTLAVFAGFIADTIISHRTY